MIPVIQIRWKESSVFGGKWSSGNTTVQQESQRDEGTSFVDRENNGLRIQKVGSKSHALGVTSENNQENVAIVDPPERIEVTVNEHVSGSLERTNIGLDQVDQNIGEDNID